MVNAAGEDNGRATLSFERALYYPSVSLYQLQTQSLHLTICGRNVFTTQTYPIATMCIPLMIAIKQHHPTWYPLSYNPDLITSRSQQTSVNLEQESWEKLEGWCTEVIYSIILRICNVIQMLQSGWLC